jgi:hypothetical protein
MQILIARTKVDIEDSPHNSAFKACMQSIRSTLKDLSNNLKHAQDGQMKHAIVQTC